MRYGKKNDAKYLKRIGNYAFGDIIGEGSSSLVRKASDPTGIIHAVKIIPKLTMADVTVAKHFQSEIRVNQQLHCSGIVLVEDIIKDGLFYYVIMEYCAQGSLTHYIREKKRVEIQDCQIIMKQLLLTLEHVHSLGICHRDLKPDNILFDARGNCKISDFGLAMFCSGGRMCRDTVGTPGYHSPESLSGSPYDGRRSDIWSLGIVMYSMLMGDVPWDTHNQKQMANQIRRGRFEIPTRFGDDVERVLRKMLTMNPAKRATAKELLDDPWISACVYRPEFRPPTRFLSLKDVDRFFGKDKVEVEFAPVGELGRSASMENLTIDATVKMLGGTRKKVVKVVEIQRRSYATLDAVQPAVKKVRHHKKKRRKHKSMVILLSGPVLPDGARKE